MLQVYASFGEGDEQRESWVTGPVLITDAGEIQVRPRAQAPSSPGAPSPTPLQSAPHLLFPESVFSPLYL